MLLYSKPVLIERLQVGKLLNTVLQVKLMKLVRHTFFLKSSVNIFSASKSMRMSFAFLCSPLHTSKLCSAFLGFSLIPSYLNSFVSWVGSYACTSGQKYPCSCLKGEFGDRRNLFH